MSADEHDRTDAFVEEAIELEMEVSPARETVEQAKAHLLIRVARITAGVIVLLAGIIMLAAPGPGLVGIALGLILLSYDVPFAARLLERIRHRLPHDENGDLQVPKGMLALSITLLLVSVGGAIWWRFLR
jgi:uncharacterized protein (TIGR02611 family)